ncbi:MAG: hypothetical protein ABF932_04770 [Gluconobacter potus]|uniref:Uncharacterized protein n=1 Tax=Gluconobacter potus TaxID=2724927 RepID=A0ABR9YIS0_9PROT|nr:MULTISPECIES: hypothetical protein [Gluconobacter]MBF0863487.1 hypothetical protein [Gluconobacter sp. R71656]MBF0866294.1 hypothetical protein [Gluconobacter sp. R75628]MBF0872578.1 hypothetical protein [Gluconobacter sp. R75629]MBF0881544.1 hypothetical protein [Gluconobacter potus]
MSRTESLLALTTIVGLVWGYRGGMIGAELALGILCTVFALRCGALGVRGQVTLFTYILALNSMLLQGHGYPRLGLCMFLGAMALAILRMTGVFRETSAA